MTLPQLIDVRDDLDRAAERSDADLSGEFGTIRDRLDAFADRDRADREGVLDEVDNQLLRIEEQLDDEAAARAIQSARNRLQIYRDHRGASDEDLAVVDSVVRERADADADGVLPVGEATLSVSVTNTGADTEFRPTLTFYDEDLDAVETVRGPEFRIADGEQEEFELTVDVPTDATSYAVSVTDTGNVRDRSED